MRETRTTVMILVEASWEDQSGTLQAVRARMENRSSGGACIRVKTRIGVGAKLWIHSRWEEFSGVAKYCRAEGWDYVLGIQRDTTKTPIPKRIVSAEVPWREDLRSSAGQVVTAIIQSVPERQEGQMSDIPVDKQKLEDVPIVPNASFTTAMAPREVGHKTVNKERKHMQRKWFELGHRGSKRDDLNGKSNGKGETGSQAPKVTPPLKNTFADAAAESAANFQGDLLSVEDIYREAGIMNPRKGYSINKVIQMLHSEHIRGLSKEMKRAAVLMALDAAGIAIDEVLQDAKVREEAIGSYEAGQRKQIEARWARKVEENNQIQAELEQVKTRYMERIKRNLDGVEREKATFGNWLTIKQQESQSIAEAVELCLNPTAPESANGSLPAVSLEGVIAKLV